MIVEDNNNQGQVKDNGAPPAREDDKAMSPPTTKPAAPVANVEQAVKEAIEDDGYSSSLSGAGLSVCIRTCIPIAVDIYLTGP